MISKRWHIGYPKQFTLPRVSQISIYACCVSACLRAFCPFFGANDSHILNPQKRRFVSQMMCCLCASEKLLQRNLFENAIKSTKTFLRKKLDSNTNPIIKPIGKSLTKIECRPVWQTSNVLPHTPVQPACEAHKSQLDAPSTINTANFLTAAYWEMTIGVRRL